MIDDTIAKIGGSSIVTLALAYAARAFVLRLSRDRVDRARDSAEIDLIGVLRNEAKLLREALVSAYSERNAAIEELGGLRTEVRLLREQIARLESQVHRLSRIVADDKPQPEGE